MLNHKLAANLLKHIFQTSGWATYSNTSVLNGFEGQRYLALFSEMPTHEAKTNEDGNIEYVINPGVEPWGTTTPGEKINTGYLRTILSNSTLSGEQDRTAIGIGTYYPGTGATGISNALIISDPKLGTGEIVNTGYGTTLNFENGSTYIHNSDMIFFPESLTEWGNIRGFGIFNDPGCFEDNATNRYYGYGEDKESLAALDSNYYTNHLLFWGTLTPQEEKDPDSGETVIKDYITVGQNEIAIFRNNDFQVSINNEETATE